VGNLAKIQEEALNQQSRLHQNKLDGFQSIHFTTENFLLRVGTEDGQSAAAAISPLARAMLQSKKKDVALELFMLELNSRGIRCQITTAFLDALFTGNLSGKSTSNVPNASSFGCSSSLAGTRLEDIDLTLALRKDDNDKEMTDKEKAALTDDTLLLCVTASQLTKVMHIIASAIEVYLGPCALLSTWYRGWADFVKEEEDFIAESTRLLDHDLPTKIQSLIETTANDYATEARFNMPDDAILDTDDIMRGIKRRHCPFKMLPAIEAVLHPPTPTRGKGSGGGGGGNPDKPSKNQAKTAKHKDSDLKCSHKMFNLVIQKQGLYLRDVPCPMFNANVEECAKYVFTGLCKNSNCERKAAHTPPQGQRKLDLVKYKTECLARYNAAKSPSDPDFR
jgi:hypothetical protein